jgi:hypothetical protein
MSGGVQNVTFINNTLVLTGLYARHYPLPSAVSTVPDSLQWNRNKDVSDARRICKERVFYQQSLPWRALGHAHLHGLYDAFCRGVTTQ